MIVRRPVLLVVLRAALLALLPAFAAPLLAWSSAAVPSVAVLDLTPSSAVSAPPAGEAAGDGLVVTGHTSARQAPTERVSGAAPPPSDEPVQHRAVPAPPRPVTALPRGLGPDTAPPRTSGHEPTLGRAPPSVTRT
ncbi:hypothetical protein [Aquipuribacter sp. MA13-6]|uniref:hypothetical protein n=1 Tax=unclassified Aquipuribacter TaxID=2635084 RepID=UPI003EE9D2E2